MRVAGGGGAWVRSVGRSVGCVRSVRLGCLRAVGGGCASLPSSPGAPRLASLRSLLPAFLPSFLPALSVTHSRYSVPLSPSGPPLRARVSPQARCALRRRRAPQCRCRRRRGRSASSSLPLSSGPRSRPDPLRCRSPVPPLLLRSWRARPLVLLRGLLRTRRVGRVRRRGSRRGRRLREVPVQNTGPGPPPTLSLWIGNQKPEPPPFFARRGGLALAVRRAPPGTQRSPRPSGARRGV